MKICAFQIGESILFEAQKSCGTVTVLSARNIYDDLQDSDQTDLSRLRRR